MTNREISEIVKAAERHQLDDLECAQFILDRGVTLAEYRRFAMRKTVRFGVVCLIVATVWCAACRWAVRTWGPPEQRVKQGGGRG